MAQNAGVLYILTSKCASRHSGVPFFQNFSTSERQKVVRTWQFFVILTCKCASRHSGVQFFHIPTSKSGPSLQWFEHFDLQMCFAPQRRAIFPEFFDIWTSKSGPYLTVFCHFDLQMCFAPQRRAIFPHPNFKKWSEHTVIWAFWLANVLRATAACKFWTSQLQKVVRTCSDLSILTCKCASRYSGVQIFDILTSKSGLRPSVFSILTSKCASRYSGVPFFWTPLNCDLRTRRYTEVTFRPSRATNHCKTQHFATFLPFRACVSSNLSHMCILFPAALVFQLSILSEVRLLNFLRKGYILMNSTSKNLT